MKKGTAMGMALAQPGYRRLFAGQVLSDFANWLDFIVLSTIVVYVWGHGSFAVALLSLAMGLPWVIIGPIAAGRVGRFSGKRVLILCDLLRAVFVFLMMWAPNLGLLLPLVFLKMSASSVFDPVRQREIRHLAGGENLAQVSSLSQLSVSATKIIGPMAGGFCMSWLGKDSAFLIGSALYLLSAWILTGLPAERRDIREDAPDQVRTAADCGTDGTADQEVAATAGAVTESSTSEAAQEDGIGGWRRTWAYIMDKPALRAAILYAAALFFLIFLYDGLIVLLIRDVGMGEEQFGLLIGAVGGGSVLGALAAGYWTGWRRRPLSRMSGAGVLSGILIALAGAGSFGALPPDLALWLPLFALLGFIGAQGTVPFGYVLQTESADETIGPVSAFASALQTGSMLVAPFLGAFAARLWSAGAVFLAVGAATAVLALLVRLRLPASPHLSGIASDNGQLPG
ncbi:MFS transporter [Gorillibacterium massiliense]|uniref:MFS transporter n=1 Tax=Gorillibacterium massiliense TaxID=1280390 RepID=UPI0004BA6335|nr:MFS transporter [Gorillibacterium massiliense]